MWKHDINTSVFRAAIQKEIEAAGRELAEGILLLHDSNEKIAREYCATIGYIEGLKYIEEYLEIGEESDDRSESVFGEDVS